MTYSHSTSSSFAHDNIFLNFTLTKAKKPSKRHNATNKPSIPVEQKENNVSATADAPIPRVECFEEAFLRETSPKKSPVKAGTDDETESESADNTYLELSHLVDNLKKRSDDNSELLQQPPSKLLRTEIDGVHERAEIGDSEGADDHDAETWQEKIVAGILDEDAETAHEVVGYDEVKIFDDELDSECDTKVDDIYCGSLQPFNLEQNLSNMQQQRPRSASTPERTEAKGHTDEVKRAEVKDKIPKPTALEMAEKKDGKEMGTENLPPKENNQSIAVVSEISGAIYAQKVQILQELNVCDEKEDAKSSLDDLYDCREPGDRVVKATKSKNNSLNRSKEGSPMNRSKEGSPMNRSKEGSPMNRSKDNSPLKPPTAGIAAHGAVTADEYKGGEEVIYWRQEVIQKHMESYPEGTFNPAYPSETRSFCFTAGFDESALKGDPYSSNGSETNAQKRWKYLNFFSFEKKFFNENGKEIVQNLKIWILPFWTIFQFLTRLLLITIPLFGFNLLVEFNYSMFKLTRRVVFYWFELCIYCFISLPVQIATTMLKKFFSFLFSTVSATAEYTPGGIRIVRTVKESVKKLKNVKLC